MVTQAPELHNSRAGATLDVDLLRRGANFYATSASHPLDFRSTMEGIDGARAHDRHRPVRRPPSLHAFMTSQRPSSEATTLDELPAPLVRGMASKTKSVTNRA